MFGPITAGATAGIVANEAQRHIDKHIHQDRDNESLLSELKEILCDVRSAMHGVAVHYEKFNETPITQTITLQAEPVRYRLSTQGRTYNALLSSVNAVQVTANVPGLGPLQFTPSIGWTELDLPDGTELYLASGTTPQSFILRCTNVPLGANAL